MERKLLVAIEELRRKMHEYADGKGLTDPGVVEISQELDRLLNQYYFLKLF